MSAVTYNNGNLVIAGPVETKQVPLAADTLYPGMALEYNATNHNYEVLSTGTVAGIYNGIEKTLSSAGYGEIILGGEVAEDYIVDGSNVAITFTDDMRDLYYKAGFFLK